MGYEEERSKEARRRIQRQLSRIKRLKMWLRVVWVLKFVCLSVGIGSAIGVLLELTRP